MQGNVPGVGPPGVVPAPNGVGPVYVAQPKNDLVVLALVLAFFFPIVGFGLSVAGLSRSDNQKNEYVVAMVISCVMFIAQSFLAWVILSFVADIVKGIRELEDAGF